MVYAANTFYNNGSQVPPLESKKGKHTIETRQKSDLLINQLQSNSEIRTPIVKSNMPNFTNKESLVKDSSQNKLLQSRMSSNTNGTNLPAVQSSTRQSFYDY